MLWLLSLALGCPEDSSHWLNPAGSQRVDGAMEARPPGPRETEVQSGFAAVDGNYPVSFRSFADHCGMAGCRKPCLSSTPCPSLTLDGQLMSSATLFWFLIIGVWVASSHLFLCYEFGKWFLMCLNREMLVSRVKRETVKDIDWEHEPWGHPKLGSMLVLPLNIWMALGKLFTSEILSFSPVIWRQSYYLIAWGWW